jgi:hypothetical protein
MDSPSSEGGISSSARGMRSVSAGLGGSAAWLANVAINKRPKSADMLDIFSPLFIRGVHLSILGFFNPVLWLSNRGLQVSSRVYTP